MTQARDPILDYVSALNSLLAKDGLILHRLDTNEDINDWLRSKRLGAP